MSTQEKEILNVIEKALPRMSEFDKGYFYGLAKASVELKEGSTLREVREPELAATG